MIRIISCLLSCLFADFCYSQQAGEISGKVTDKNNQAVEFVSVFLTSIIDSNKIINGAVTDSAGNFIISNIAFGEYNLHLQAIGYSKYILRVSLSADNKKNYLPAIILESDVRSMQAAEVTALRNMIKKTEEGIVLNASENLTQIGGTAAELLRNMPGVQVSAEGEITLRGKTPLILINGRVSGTAGSDRSANLEQIPATSVERIEIITNPSARYDADAESGIINIILKRSLDVGTNGAFAFGVGFGERYRLNGMALVNRKTGKWNFGLAYDNWYTTRTRRVNGDRVQYQVPDEYFLTQRRFDERRVQNQNGRLNIDYTPHKNSSLSMEALLLSQGEDNSETLTSTTETFARQFTNRNRRHSNEIRRFNSGEVLLNYSQRFKHIDQLLTGSISLAGIRNKENTDITAQSLTQQHAEIGNAYLQKTHNFENSGITNISFDYTHPLKEIAKIETGYKATLRYIDNDFLRENDVNGSFVIDKMHTDVFNFKEQIHAAYLQYTGWTGKKELPDWKYTLGLRAEQVWNNSSTASKVLALKNEYFNLYPSASLIFYTARRNMARLSYSRRINRPTFGQLIPFTDITDSLNTRSGNPKLKPELSHSIDLSYNPSLKNGNFIISAFYRHTSDIILPYTTLDTNGVAFTLPRNFGKAATYGAEAIVVFNPFRFMNISLNISAYEMSIDNKDPSSNIQRSQFTYFSKLITNLTIWKNGRIQLTGNYTSPVAIPQGERIAVYFVDLGIQQKVIKGQGRLALAVTDIFNTQESGTITSDANFRFSRIFKVDTRAIMLTFGYTFKSTFKENLMENKFRNE
jgi:outer membrane receptor protein involved in Fe transport